MSDIIVRYFHFIGIIVMSAALAAEHLLLKSRLSGDEIRRLAIVDIVFAVAATVVLVAGLALWLWVGKPAEFYTRNGIFHAKLTLFILMALISLYPTAYFLRNRRAGAAVVEVPKAVIMVIRFELLLLLVIPLLAVLMARGIGLSQ